MGIKAVKTTILGAREIQKLIAKLPAKIGANVARGMARLGTPIIVEGVRRRAEGHGLKETGLYVQSIKGKSPRVMNGEVVAGVDLDRTRRGPKRIWHLLEFGHAVVAERLLGKTVIGFAPAYPHWRPAIEEDGPTAIRVMTEYAEKRIPKEVKKLARQARKLLPGKKR